MMPPPNQIPSEDQPFILSTDRQKSSIPNANKTGESWISITTDVLECYVEKGLEMER